MVVLSKEFKNKIVSRYEEKGIDWLNSIDGIIYKYTKKFNLKNIKILDNLTMNIVITANSDDFGDIIMKIGTPGITSVNEIKYINLLTLKHMVKCYYYNIDDRVMILERIYPGYSLNEIKNIDDKIEIFSNMLDDICSNSKYYDEFPTYDRKLKQKVEEVKKYSNTYPNLVDMINTSTKMYQEISSMKLPKYILHDDLQPINILKSTNGWKMIDPHGIVGEKIFETCQFIKSALQKDNFTIDNLKIIVKKVSKRLNEDENLIYKSLYIDYTIKILFYIKSGYDENIILQNIDICKAIFNCIE